MNVLLIVETPHKAKRLRELFPEFTVLATLGHFIDLIPEGLGTRQPNHQIRYNLVDGKQQVLTKLRAEAQIADVVYVATNPDQEGEAIAAQVFNALDKPHAQKVQRITPIAITRTAIQTALNNARNIDWLQVRAYEARRVVERYIGFCVSTEVSKKFTPLGFTSFMTSGRVQSLALKLIVERQRAIESFIPVETFGITASINVAGKTLTTQWKPDAQDSESIKRIHHAEKILARTHALTLVGTRSSTQTIAPPQSLNTCSYVRLIASKLKLTAKQAMDAAQTLYEQGLITYHRTTNTCLSLEFATIVCEFAKHHALPLPEIETEKKIQNDLENNSQTGECLRVTDIYEIEPDTLKHDKLLRDVYQAIWLATLESQLTHGDNQETSFIFENNYHDQFVAIETRTQLLGWREIAIKFGSVKNTEHAQEALEFDSLEFNKNEFLPTTTIQITACKTESPTPYTESSLVEKLNELGIGTPNTYTDTLERIIVKQYVSRDEDTLQLTPNAIGIVLINTLDKNFSWLDYSYAAHLETAFTDIAKNLTNYLAVVNLAWFHLEHELETFKRLPLIENVTQQIRFLSNREIKPTNRKSAVTKPRAEHLHSCSAADTCPTCRMGNLRVTQFTQGELMGRSFVGCSIFPACDYFQLVQ